MPHTSFLLPVGLPAPAGAIKGFAHFALRCIVTVLLLQCLIHHGSADCAMKFIQTVLFLPCFPDQGLADCVLRFIRVSVMVLLILLQCLTNSLRHITRCVVIYV